MKIEKRHVVGILMLIPFLPVFLLGFVAYWLYLYGYSGYQTGEIIYEWIESKVNENAAQKNEEW